MTSDAEPTDGPQQDHTFSIISIPDHLTQQVVDYIEALMDEDDDTSGYMIGGISMASGAGPLSEKMKHSDCTWKKTGDFGWDVYCND